MVHGLANVDCLPPMPLHTYVFNLCYSILLFCSEVAHTHTRKIHIANKMCAHIIFLFSKFALVRPQRGCHKMPRRIYTLLGPGASSTFHNSTVFFFRKLDVHSSNPELVDMLLCCWLQFDCSLCVCQLNRIEYGITAAASNRMMIMLQRGRTWSAALEFGAFIRQQATNQLHREWIEHIP